MWARLRRSKKSRRDKSNIDDPPKDAEHHYFKGHMCSIPLRKQTKYEIEDNRKRRWNAILHCTAVRSGDVRARFLYRSYAALAAEIHRHYTQYPCAIHPYSRLRLIVEIISMIYIQICIVFLDIHFIVNDETKVTARLINACELLHCITIILNFFTGYEQGRSSRFIVLDGKKIACHYLSSTLLILDLAFVAGLASLFLTYEVWVDTIMALLKMGILPVYFIYTSNVLEVFGVSERAKTLINVTQIILNYLLWNIILQFSLEYYEENSRTPPNPRHCSWLTLTGMWNYTFISRTSNSFHRAVGMLQQNSNLNLLEQEGCFVTFFILAWRFGWIVTIHCALRCTVMFIGLESSQAKYFMMTQQVQTYMDQRRFPARIKKKILKLYAVRYQTNFFVEHKMMECVSGRLREDIIMHSGRQLVGEVEFLKHLPRSLLLQISVKLKMIIFLAGDIIFKINSIGDCLYFIDKGTVAIYSESGQEICHLQDGDFFGEIALVLQPHFRTATVVAVTNCELFRLDKKDFESTIAVFPTVYEDIKKVAYDRLEKTTVMDEHHKTELRREEDDDNS
ncbi:cyclic nucleotide-binding domain-containing protein [Phthorimaea operculella]|nr:cyclic nucleotide-binding domain-containing protein [Phthorimaea operculella]